MYIHKSRAVSIYAHDAPARAFPVQWSREMGVSVLAGRPARVVEYVFQYLALGLGVHACGDRGGAWLACARAHTVVTQRRQWRNHVWEGYAVIRKAVGNKAANSGITGFIIVRQR